MTDAEQDVSSETAEKILSSISPEEKGKIAETATYCAAQAKRAKKIAISCAAIFIPLSLLGLIGGFQLFFFLIFAAVMITIIVSSVSMKQANDLFKSKVVPDVIQAVYGPSAKYFSKEGWDRDYISRLRLFQGGNIYETSDEMTGAYKGVNFIVANVTTGNRTSNGRSSSTVYYFRGLVAVYDFNKQIKSGSLEIREDEGNGGYSLIYGRSQRIDFEDIVFNKQFNVYSADKEGAFYVITPQFIEAFKEIKKRIPGTLIFSIQNGKLIIAINGATNKFGFSFKTADVNDIVERLIKEILPYKWFVDVFSLDDSFGKKAVQKAIEDAAEAKADADKNLDIQDKLKNAIDASSVKVD